MPDLREDQDPKAPGHRNRTLGMVTVLLLLLAVPLGATVWNTLQSEGVAPEFTLTDTGYEDGRYRDPQAFSLSDYRGKVVLLDFMAVNCPGCDILAKNVLQPVFEKYGDRDDFAMLSIDGWAGSAGETREDLIGLQRDLGNRWPHALDTDNVMRKYGVYALPTVFVVDGEGRLVHSSGGYSSDTGIENAIEEAYTGDAQTIGVLSIGAVGLAFVAGIASFFAPCSVGLIPAYMGFLIQGQQGLEKKQALRHAMRGGAATAGGIVTLYAGIAVILLALSLVGLDSVIRNNLGIFALVVGSLLIALGVMMFFGFDWEGVSRRFGMGKVDGRKGFFPFGIGYGLAAFGCTGPIFLPVLFAGFAEGVGVGILAFLVYAGAIAGLVLFAAYLVAGGQQTRLRALLSHTKAISRVSAVLLVVAGVAVVLVELAAW